MKKNKSIGRILIIVVIGLLLGVKLFMWNAKSLVGNELPMPFGYGIAVVMSGSMEPELSKDDLILVEKQQEYQLEDVVVYQTGDSLVVHRIIAMDEDQIVTQGDANQAADKPIRVEFIKGEVIGKLEGAGKFVKLIKSPVVTVILIAAGVALLELSFRKEKKAGEESLEKIKEEIRRLKDEQK